MADTVDYINQAERALCKAIIATFCEKNWGLEKETKKGLVSDFLGWKEVRGMGLALAGNINGKIAVAGKHMKVTIGDYVFILSLIEFHDLVNNTLHAHKAPADMVDYLDHLLHGSVWDELHNPPPKPVAEVSTLLTSAPTQEAAAVG